MLPAIWRYNKFKGGYRKPVMPWEKASTGRWQTGAEPTGTVVTTPSATADTGFYTHAGKPSKNSLTGGNWPPVSLHQYGE